MRATFTFKAKEPLTIRYLSIDLYINQIFLYIGGFTKHPSTLAIALPIILVICAGLAVTASDSATRDIDADVGELIAETTCPVIEIIGPTAEDLIEEFESIEYGDIVCISGQSVDTIMYNNPEKMRSIIDSGTPLIIEGDTAIISTIATSIVLNPNADCNAVYHDPITGTTYCFGIEGAGGESIRYASEWLRDKISSVHNASAQVDIDFNNCIIYQA